MCVFLAHVQLFGVVATPPHFVSPVIPLSLLSTTGSEWVIQMLNSIILGIYPSALLWWVATLLCDQNPFNPAIRIIFSPGLYLISLTVSKTLLNINIHCFPLMHQTSLFFIGSYQLCQKWCLLPRPVLTTPTPCFSLFLQMISRIFSLFSLRVWGEADWPSILKKESTFAFSSPQEPSWYHDVSRIIVWSHGDNNQIPQYLQLHSIRSYRLVCPGF